MVVFTCNHCGESLKKNSVEKHNNSRCRKPISVGCMDCFKDFDRETYSAHTQCMTELERYSGKDYVAKANANKGQRKQEAWVDMVRGIVEKKANISKGVKDILTQISSYDNIPRKKAKFLNFMRNSFRYMKLNELEEAWTLLEVAMKENQPTNNGTTEDPTTKEEEKTQMNGNGIKRKLEEPEEEEAAVPEPSKKKKKTKQTNGTHEELNGTTSEEQVSTTSTESKFKWQETIKNILSTKNNEIKLKKLKKKVLKQYQLFTGLSIISDKFENKFNKKISKLKGVVVENDKVRLID